jgi:hypothetical protein
VGGDPLIKVKIDLKAGQAAIFQTSQEGGNQRQQVFLVPLVVA